jgi:hypothetical protein
VVKLAVVYCQRKRQQQQHHQRTNGSTNVKTFTSPDNLDLINLSTVFEFNKQKVWDKKEQGSNGRNNRKSKNKEEYMDPIVYFPMVVFSKVEPREIIDRVTHEWERLNGMRLQVKDLQFVDSKTIVGIFKVSTTTKKKLSTQS